MRMDGEWQWHDQKAKVKSRIASISLKKTWLQLQQQQLQQALQQLEQQLELQQLPRLMQFAYAV